ncbi:unnamed protein product, partial [Prorocentrum cordatum]
RWPAWGAGGGQPCSARPRLRRAMKLVSPHDVMILLSSQRVQLIDVRDFDRSLGFIPTSRHVPSQRFDDQALQLAREFGAIAKKLSSTALGRTPCVPRAALGPSRRFCR